MERGRYSAERDFKAYTAKAAVWTQERKKYEYSLGMFYERIVSEMERLTEKRQWQNTIPLIKENSKKRFTHLWNGVKCVDIRDCCIGIVKGHICGEAVNRLAAYEDTGLTPEEIEALKADNDRLHRLIDELEIGLRKE